MSWLCWDKTLDDDDEEEADDVKQGHLRWATSAPAQVVFVFPADVPSTDAETSEEAKLITSITSKMNSLMLIQMWITIKQKHWNVDFFKYSTSPIPALIISAMIYHCELFPHVTGLLFMHRHYSDLFRHAKSMLTGRTPSLMCSRVCMQADTWAGTKGGRWKWEVLLTSTPDSCSWISKNSCGRWQVLLVFTHYL